MMGEVAPGKIAAKEVDAREIDEEVLPISKSAWKLF